MEMVVLGMRNLENRTFKSHNEEVYINLFDANYLKKLISNYFVIEKFFCLPYDEINIWDSKPTHFFKRVKEF